jgi:hypothetical protein
VQRISVYSNRCICAIGESAEHEEFHNSEYFAL